MTHKACCAIGTVLGLWGLSTSCVAEQSAPVAVRVLNLSSQSINAFYIGSLPFRMVGLDARPGEPLTPAFGDGQMSYEIYWRQADGSMHGAIADLRRDLPASFYGNVIISLHDNGLAVSWANMTPEWVEYSRVGDPKKYPRPEKPYYDGCAGIVFEDRLTAGAWKKAAERVRENSTDAHAADLTIEDNRCNLDWRIPRAAERPRINPDEETARRLEKEWREQIDAYRAGSRSPNVADQ